MENQKEETKKNKTVIFLAFLLLISIVGNLIQLKTTGDYKEETTVKIEGLEEQFETINKLYDESMAMVESYKSENTAINSELENKISELKALKVEIENLKKSVKDKSQLAAQLKAKYEKIIALNADLENRIDDLLVENKVLFDKNESLKEGFDSLNLENNALDAKVNTGSKLKAEYFLVSTFKKRSSGKFKETKLAKRANKVEVTFALLDNAIAEKGEKTVFLRIVAPTGKVLGNPIMGSEVFQVDGMEEEQKYSVKKVYTYTGEKQELTLSYVEEELRFEEGEYSVEIYVDSYLSGKSTFSLK